MKHEPNDIWPNAEWWTRLTMPWPDWQKAQHRITTPGLTYAIHEFTAGQSSTVALIEAGFCVVTGGNGWCCITFLEGHHPGDVPQMLERALTIRSLQRGPGEPCKECGGTGFVDRLTRDSMPPFPQDHPIYCKMCKSTGRIYPEPNP